MAGKQGYTVYWSDGKAEDFMSENDFSAICHAIALACDKGVLTFDLYRTGYDRWHLRQIASITDKL